VARDPLRAVFRRRPAAMAMLDRYRADPAALRPAAGCCVNWMGVQTEAALFAYADALVGRVFADLPLPGAGDGVHGRCEEYLSVAAAVESRGARDRFVAGELGAGFGPWLATAAFCCRRAGVAAVDLLGVEADAAKCEAMRRHLSRNGVIGAPGVSARITRGAAWREDATLRFGVVDPRHDYGGAVTAEANPGRDYRGLSPDYVEVPGYSLQTLCRDLPVIDYMHWDIQGAELEVARAAIDFLDERARFLFIGTHSPLIEGSLLDLFHQRQWDVLHFANCKFAYKRAKPSLAAMTVLDGEMFLRNPRLVA
jgi:hypothetical protein